MGGGLLHGKKTTGLIILPICLSTCADSMGRMKHNQVLQLRQISKEITHFYSQWRIQDSHQGQARSVRFGNDVTS